MSIDNVQMHPQSTGMPVIQVFGVGGGGGNVVNRMVQSQIQGVQYISANTDVMVLNSSLADIKVTLGTNTTRGLGAGMRPEVGKAAALIG